MEDGVFYEFYSSNGELSSDTFMRKGPVIKPYNYHIRYQAIRDYGWTASLYAALILEHPDLF